MSGRLGRSLLRSFLRFGSSRRFPQSPLVLQRSSGRVYNLSLHSTEQEGGMPLGQISLPASVGVETVVMSTGRELANMIKRVFKSNSATSDGLDKALDALKRLNVVWADIREKHKLREQNSRDDVLAARTFRVGQVVSHKDSGTRAVVVGWVIDEASKKLAKMKAAELTFFRKEEAIKKIEVSECVCVCV